MEKYREMGLLIPHKGYKSAPKRFYGIFTKDAKTMPCGLTVESMETWKKFFGFKPCLFRYGKVLGYLDLNDYSKFEDGRPTKNDNGSKGDIMVEYPRRGIRIRFNDKAIEICVTDDPNKEGYSYHAFPAVAEHPVEHFYLGAYRSSIMQKMMRSLPDQRLIASNRYSFEDMQHLAHRRGRRCSPMGFYQATYLQIMWLFMTRGTMYNTYPLMASYIESKPTEIFDDDILISSLGKKLFGLVDFSNGVHYDLIDGCYIRNGELFLTETPSNLNEFKENYTCKGVLHDTPYGEVTMFYPSSDFGFLEFDSVRNGKNQKVMSKDRAGIQEYYDAEKTIPSFFQHGMFDMDFSVPNNVGTIHGTTRLMYL